MSIEQRLWRLESRAPKTGSASGTLERTRTFHDTPDDGTGKDAENPRAFARVYCTHIDDPAKRWFWTISSGDARVASGHKPTKEEARGEANQVLADWLTRNSRNTT